MENSKVGVCLTREEKDASKSHTVASLSIYSIIMRNTGIIHIINYSRPQVIKPRYYWRHWSYTSDWVIDIKNPCARRLFIPLIVGINDKYREFPSFGGMQPKSQKVDVQKFLKMVTFINMVFNKEFVPFYMSHT